MADSKSTLYCSFCGKSQDDVKQLIAGPTVFICDECVRLCMDIVVAEQLTSVDPSEKSPLQAVFNTDGMKLLEGIEIPSLQHLIADGGLEQKRGPYNGHQLLRAVISGLENVMDPIAAEARRVRREAIEALKAEIVQDEEAERQARVSCAEATAALAEKRTRLDELICGRSTIDAAGSGPGDHRQLM